MRSEPVRKLLLGLALLVATLSSAPLGSMEQAGAAASGTALIDGSLSAPRPGAAPALQRGKALARSQRGWQRADHIPAFPRAAWKDALPTPRLTFAAPAAPPADASRSLLERLPYHATAPPTLA